MQIFFPDAAVTLAAQWLGLITAAAARRSLRALALQPIFAILCWWRYSPTAGQSRPLSFVSSMLPTRPSRLCLSLVIVFARPSSVRYVCYLPLIELARLSHMFVTTIVVP